MVVFLWEWTMGLLISALGVNNQSQELFDPTIATKRSKCDSMTSQSLLRLLKFNLWPQVRHPRYVIERQWAMNAFEKIKNEIIRVTESAGCGWLWPFWNPKELFSLDVNLGRPKLICHKYLWESLMDFCRMAVLNVLLT